MTTQENISNQQLNIVIAMSGEKKWLNRLNLIIEKNMADSFFSNSQMAMAMEVSERHLFRKVKLMSKMSPQKYLSQYRLNQAMQYLKYGKFRTVKETAYAVGFKNPSYFIRQFEKAFGVRPLRVLQEAGWR